ncbi:HAD-IC family P-type ATPase [Dehalococcoidales bacterium]|nr:HAD-IC family P-type ATPase [Dehalococcoidales bacterium]
MLNGKSWYQLPIEQVFKALEAGGAGLTSSEAKARLEKYGYNEIEVKKRSPLVRFLLQFHNPLLYLLILAAIICVTILGKFLDAAVIMAVVLGTVIIGFIQEGKAEASLEALKKMMVPQCTVLRDGERKIIRARELVPGDVVLLEGGDRVPADLRLFYAKNLTADEAILTGESTPVTKNIEPVPRPNLGPGEQRCMAFSGTFITRGSAQGIVIGTGKETEIGKIAGLMKKTEKVTPPIMRKIAGFTMFLMIVIPSLGVINFIVGVVFGFEAAYMFLAAIALIVAGIPEGLPAAVIATFAFGTIAMARRNALIRRLPAAETLGCTTVICSDKTGTLTKNEMTVVRVHCGGNDYRVSGVGYEPKGEFIQGDKRINPVPEDKILAETLTAGYLCNNAALVEDEQGYSIKGDPTEGALVVSAIKAGITENLPRLDEIPFEPEQQYMATLHQGKGENIIYVKGSPEMVLRMCHNQLIEGSIEPIRSEQVLEKADEMAKDALRVLGMAYKVVDKAKTSLEPEDMKELTFLGLQGMIDPPRGEAIAAVKKCKTAGIRVVMITGDHVQTAKAIARQLGIGEGEDRGLTGEELQRMSDEELYEVVNKVSVYARVAPEHKFRIVRELQRRGQIVAVTGDGVNDAPALKRADIGVAMGITGTEVSKEASDMVLTDDNFASIVAAVEEGRHVFNNIWKVILYLLPTNGGQVLVIIGAVLLSPLIPIFAVRLPLDPLQVLWVNLIIAIACAIPLAREVKEKGILDKPPRDIGEPLANTFFFQRVGLVSVVEASAVFTMFSLFLAVHSGSAPLDPHVLLQATTLAFTTLIFVEVCYIFTARSVRASAFTFSPFSNKWVLIGVATTLGLQVLHVYTYPLFGFSPFRTMPFPVEWWLAILLITPAGFFAVELEKLLRRRLGKAAL